MNVNKKTLGLNNGWILCPSKSFPGKFYYFNVLNGEAAWSLNDADKKGLRKESSIHKITDKSHDYPEPTTLPDDTSIISTFNIGTNSRKSDFQPKNIPYTQQLPTFGQAAYPKYIANVEPLMPNIVWTPIQLPMPMFCPDNRKPMIDEVTQTSELERDLFIQTCNIPLCKRFKNYETPSLSFDRKNKIVNKPISKFETSTPLKKPVMMPVSENSIPKSKSLIKEPVLKWETKFPNSKIEEIVKCKQNSTVNTANRVESSKYDKVPIVEKEDSFENLDRTDLRFLLMAKRRKSMDATTDDVTERKKPKPSDVEHTTPKKKVTFDLKNISDDDTVMSDDNVDFIPLTMNQFTPKNPPRHLKTETVTPTSGTKNDTHTLLNTEMPSTPSVTNNTHRGVPKEFPRPVEKKDCISPTSQKSDVWFIVVDTDVFLLDYEFIDHIVVSDRKCMLLVPHAVRADLEGLCLGDCRGQQRVINARQLTRRLASPPQHYIVEPPPNNTDDVVISTDSILNCCLQAIKANYYAILITNDPYLQIKASSLKIPNYKLNQIKNGVDIKPNTCTEHKNIKTNNFNKNTSENNTFIVSKTNLFNNADGNEDHLNHMDAVKNQLFFKDKDKSTLDCDKLINITKPKTLRNNENITKYDSDTSTTSDISREVQNLNLKDNKKILKSQNQNKNPFLKNIKEQRVINFEKKIQNPNVLENPLHLKKTISNTRSEMSIFQNIFSKLNKECDYNFQNEEMNNIQNSEPLFCSIPISNIKQFNFQNKFLSEKPSHFQNVPTSNLEHSGSQVATKNPNTSTSFHKDPYTVNRENRVLTATQSRIKKMFSTMNCDSTTNSQFENQVRDSTGVFKIPQPLQFKNRTKNTASVVSSSINKESRTQKNIDSVDENLKRFCVKSKIMSEKISTRIDEWICTYTQIMEDVLNSLLQKNRKILMDTMAPLTLHDTLNCIKMLYGSHTKIRDLLDNLSEVLSKCTCKKGKLNTALKPDDFMKLLGYGVLLVQALQNIQPFSKELNDAESSLSFLLTNVESETIELDPELLKTPSVSRTDLDSKDEEIRPNFQKEPSYVLDYLKKHFKEWKSFKGDIRGLNFNCSLQILPDYKVVRTCGKNLSMLKINSTKTISLTKNATDENNLKNKGAKLISLLENQPLSKLVQEEQEPDPKAIELLHNRQNIFLNHKYNEIDNKKTDLQNFTKENKFIVDNIQEGPEMIDQESKNQTKIIEETDFPTHGNTFMKSNETNGPKIIRNINHIDEYEKRIQNKEPLNLDLLDYSEIYEPSVNDISENLQFDVIDGNKNGASQENIKNNDNDNYGLMDKECTIEDFTKDIHLDSDGDFYASTVNNYESVNGNITIHNENRITQNTNGMFHFENNSKIYNLNDVYTKPVNNNNIDHKKNENHAEITFRTEKDTYNENNASHNDNGALYNDKYGTNNFDKTVHLVRDDSTNDSGFENDSTYAHTLVKIFLNELSTTFKVIYEFVNKFVIEIRSKELCDIRMNTIHNQASKSLEDMVAIIQRLRSIIKRESAEDTVLKTLLLNAGVEATTDKRITRYRQVVMKSLQQAQILENALKIIVSITVGDFDAISTNADSISSSIRYFNIFE